MRKNVIALSIATLVGGLGMAGGASAAVFADTSTVSPTNADFLIVTPAGLGHILVVPYFNTQGTNATLLNITNTDTANGKAMKVRFRSAANSDDVFDFQLYLSPGDVWTANIAQGADGISRMLTNDKSCTLPASINQSFVLDRLPPTASAATKASWTREGYIEILNMADVPEKAIVTTTGAEASGTNALYTAIKHVSGVAPCTAGTMNTLMNDPLDLPSAWGLGFRAPSGKVMANYIIVDTANSGSYSGEATAITAHDGFSLDPVTNLPNQGRGNIVFFPQTGVDATSPDFHTADPALRTVFGAGIGQVQNGSGGAYASGTAPIIKAAMFDLPDLSTPYVAPATSNTAPLAQAARLSNAIATRYIRNEFFTDTTVSAVTDWVFSMPFRRYAVALDYRTTTPVRAFTNYSQAGFFDYFTAANTTMGDSQVCVNTNGLTIYNREEATVTSGFVISPGTTSTFKLCGEVSVMSWNAGSATAASALSAAVARTDLAAPYRDGWANVSLPGVTGIGLPVIGAAYARAAVPAGKFGIVWEHRTGR